MYQIKSVINSEKSFLSVLKIYIVMQHKYFCKKNSENLMKVSKAIKS